MIRKSNGFSLVESLAALAILGIIIAGVSSVYMHMRDQILLSEAIREAEEMRSYTQSVLDQPTLCTGALLDQAGNNIIWNWQSNKPVSVGQLKVVGAANSGYTNQGTYPAKASYGRALKITNLYLRQSLPYEGGISSSTMTIGAKTYDTVAAKFVMNTQPSGSSTIAQISRTADVVLQIEQGSAKIVGCASAQNLGLSKSAFSCLITTPDCTTSAFCRSIKYISSFSTTGSPICACTVSCFTGPQGLTGSGAGKYFAPQPGDPGYDGTQTIFQKLNLSPATWVNPPPPPAP